MISRSPEKAIKNIFERCATSLSDSKDQLDKTRRLLKKSVHRLLVSTHRSNDQISTILNDIKSSVDTEINLYDLNSHLDKLFVLTNNSDYQKQTADKSEFYITLKDSLEDSDCSDHCTTIVNSFAERQLSDKEISLELLKLITETSLDKA